MLSEMIDKCLYSNSVKYALIEDQKIGKIETFPASISRINGRFTRREQETNDTKEVEGGRRRERRSAEDRYVESVCWRLSGSKD